MRFNVFGYTISIFSSKNNDLQLNSVQSELDDHLLAINENTNEIHANYEQLCQAENKLDKLSQKLEALELAKRRHDVQATLTKSGQLSANERRVFLALYTAQRLTFDELSEVLSLPLFAVRKYVASLAQKGIPIEADRISQSIRLPQAFKQLQAKENILGLTPVNAYT